MSKIFLSPFMESAIENTFESRPFIDENVETNTTTNHTNERINKTPKKRKRANQRTISKRRKLIDVPMNEETGEMDVSNFLLKDLIYIKSPGTKQNQKNEQTNEAENVIKGRCNYQKNVSSSSHRSNELGGTKRK